MNTLSGNKDVDTTIMKMLSIETIRKINQVNKYLYKLTNSDVLWRYLVMKEYKYIIGDSNTQRTDWKSYYKELLSYSKVKLKVYHLDKYVKADQRIECLLTLHQNKKCLYCMDRRSDPCNEVIYPYNSKFLCEYHSINCRDLYVAVNFTLALIREKGWI